MLVLALDTSSAAVTAALADVAERSDGVEILAERVTLNARGHGELLAPSISACLDQAGAEPADLDAVIAGLGPGPFTGLRVGLVTAAVLARTLSIAAYGVCSLDAIVPSEFEHDLIVAADARRKEVYWARYDASGVRIDGPHVSRADDVPTSGVRSTAGAGARLYAQQFGLRVIGGDYPSASALIARAADRVRGRQPSESLAPMYLRRPDAVANPTVKRVLQ